MRRTWRSERPRSRRRTVVVVASRPADREHKANRSLRAQSLGSLYVDRSRGATACATCLGPFTARNPMTRGHQPPLARLSPDGTLDGVRVPLVMIAQCGRCNSMQGTRTIDEWRAGAARGRHVAADDHLAVIDAQRRLYRARQEQRRSRDVPQLEQAQREVARTLERLAKERGLRFMRWRVYIAPDWTRIALMEGERDRIVTMLAERRELDVLTASLDSEVQKRRAVPAAPDGVDWTVEAAVTAAHAVAAGTYSNDRLRRAPSRPARPTAQERARQAKLEERRRAEGRCLSCGRALKRVAGRPGRPSLRCDRCRSSAST